jgi:hypothetical protein
MRQVASMLAKLEKAGCYPNLCRRGPHLWRAHINWSGNQWSDAASAREAFDVAFTAWEKAGRPMDGAACLPSEHENKVGRVVLDVLGREPSS